MAAAFDNATRELIRLWADKAPECGATDKPRAFPDVNGVPVDLNRNTVYNGTWKFRYAFVQETGFPVVMGGPIPHHLDTQQPKGKINKPKKGNLTMATADAVFKEVYPNAFQKAVQAEMQNVKAYLNKSPIWKWDDINNPLTEEAHKPSAYVEYEILPKCPACGEPGCVCYEDGI